VVTARKKKLRWPDVRAHAVSEGEGRKEGTGSGEAGMGCGLFLLLGRIGSPGSISYFSFFLLFPFSVFLFLFGFA
jgi:hypothetical protein